MAVEWTEKQKKIINHKNGNLLVAAGAGSGKTTVMNQHVLTRLDEGIDVDQLLVVTYTRAAANEMRDRLRKVIKEKIAADPNDGRYRRQEGLINTADICTIDSLCRKIMMQYFYTINIDPGMRTADKGELELLRNDVCLKVLEKQYGDEDGNGVNEAFLNFRQMYSSDTEDDAIIKMILKLYDKSRSYPDPEKWLGELREQKTSYVEKIRELIVDDFEEAVNAVQMLIMDARKAFLPAFAIDQVQADLDRLLEYQHAAGNDAEKIIEAAKNFEFTRRKNPSKKDPIYTEEWLPREDEIKAFFDGRDAAKKLFSEITSYTNLTKQFAEDEIEKLQPTVDVLLDLTEQFASDYSAQKKILNICDFADVEHYALDILYDEDGERTDIAKELAAGYKEILIDEYQDCNDVQEYILSALASETEDGSNMFMVGDVKQSIYGFRLANPKLFMNKFNRYKKGEDKCTLIELSDNFRSRRGVIAFVNDIFHSIMREELGGVEYDEGAALKAGAVYPDRESFDVELDYVIKDDEAGVDKEEQEAKFLANRVLQLLNPDAPYQVKAENGTRDITLNDIVILTKAVSSVQSQYKKVFRDYGIPLYTDNGKGYFSSIEVMDILNYLRLIDNPLQDIPMAACLRNPFGNFSADELAEISVIGHESNCKSFAEAVQYCAKDAGRLKDFMDRLNKYRKLSLVLPINELIIRILDETGYSLYVSTLPGSEKRKLNVKALIAKARDYEQTNLKGLFNFIRYIEKLQKYDVDISPEGGDNSDVNAVRLMTIHSSKGLEFPVVFISGMCREFNKQDINAAIVFSSELGIGADIRDANLRTKLGTYKKKAVRQSMTEELLSEELRVLYVAMTRAKELLILTGCGDEKYIEKKASITPDDDGRQKVGALRRAKSYMDFVMPAVFARELSLKTEIIRPYIVDMEQGKYDAEGYSLVMNKVRYNSLPGVVDHIEATVNADNLAGLDTKIRDIVGFEYAYKALAFESVARSVTDIKKDAMEEEDHEQIDFENQKPVKKTRRPKARVHKEPDEPAKRGTAVHRIMELLDFKKIGKESIKADVDAQMDEMIASGKYLKEDADRFSRSIIYKFFESQLADRMKAADAEGNLYKEYEYLMGVPVKNIKNGPDFEDLVIVRGIVDAYFYEGENIVLMDYKTDALKEGKEEELVNKYKEQLVQYKAFLKAATNKTVTECFLYSFSLGKQIEVKI